MEKQPNQSKKPKQDKSFKENSHKLKENQNEMQIDEEAQTSSKKQTNGKHNKEDTIDIDSQNKKYTKVKRKRINSDDSEKQKDRLTKKISKMNMEDKSDTESDYITDSNEEMYYDSASEEERIEDYVEQDLEEIVEKKPKKGVETVNIWDESKGIQKDEELVFDNSAYEMLHRSEVSWPCMSVDWLVPEYFPPVEVRDYFKPSSKKVYEDEFPYACYFLGGATTDEKNGVLYYMKWFNMHRTLYDEDPDKEADSESEGAEPLMEHISVTSKGNINRIKTMRNSYLAAYWSDSRSIELVDMKSLIQDMEERWQISQEQDKKQKKTKKKKLDEKQIHFKSYPKKQEGFALDWSPLLPGVLAIGGYDCNIEIVMSRDENCSDFTGLPVNQQRYDFKCNYRAHKGSVEDIVFSPVDPNVLASGGIDNAVKFWDLRTNFKDAQVNIANAHNADVNCLSWKNMGGVNLIASGSDDCSFKVWDLRFYESGPISNILYHKGPITAIDWDPQEKSTQIVVSSEDNRVSIWDFSVEADSNKVKDANDNKDIPDNLVFLHQGQKNVKDVKFHPYYRDFVLSSAENGINVFKPNFSGDEDENSEDFTFYKK